MKRVIKDTEVCMCVCHSAHLSFTGCADKEMHDSLLSLETPQLQIYLLYAVDGI